ncbi:MAG: flagellar assembly protein FliH [Woeseia sp.]|nr:flagellar assembly protein FliH [Woeseia sp.]
MSDSESRADEVNRWEVPSIEQGGGSGLMTASGLQDLQKEAYDEAYAQGHAAGLEAGTKEIAERVARLDALLVAQAKPLSDVDEIVEQQIVELAMSVARKLFRRELKQDPGHIVGVVREAVGLLPVASRDVQVRLHPDDAALIRDALAAPDGEQAWTLVEDPLIDRGGCRIISETSQVNAENSARLEALIAAISGDERHS